MICAPYRQSHKRKRKDTNYDGPMGLLLRLHIVLKTLRERTAYAQDDKKHKRTQAKPETHLDKTEQEEPDHNKSRTKT